MWGEYAIGKLVAGPEPMKPGVEVFVDDEAGDEVAQKVQRRLQHFIDRKVAALFEPLLNLSRDEALSGLARGFAFRMVENLGIISRGEIANDVKELDQDARGALRKHGIRFGQFTIFMPLLLKPAPTRLRLLLWALANGQDEFPEAPPPGLVTVPAGKGVAPGFHTMSGYRAAGERAIRIDMLERLADMLRAEDSRGGFEAIADMLSITGMTLEQFADLMQGLGYKAEKGEREKVKKAVVAPEAKAQEDAKPDTAAETAVETPAPDAVVETAPATEAVAEDVVDEAAVTTPAEAEAPEVEVFYTFTWAGNRGNRSPRREQGGQQAGGRREPQGDKPRGKGKPKGKGGPRRDQGAKQFQARPPRKEKAIDPDNPFAAALMGLKDKG